MDAGWETSHESHVLVQTPMVEQSMVVARGRHTVAWESPRPANGNYVLVIEAVGRQKSRLLTLIR